MAISVKGQAAWGQHDRWRDEARGQGCRGDSRRGEVCVCLSVCLSVPMLPGLLTRADGQGEQVAPSTTEGPGGAWEASAGF